ncbi:MAG: glycosyltransferase family 2 protein [Armatimonadota bacterium]
MKTISVLIPVFNVESIIARCLDALAWADEVVVVDMFSTDRTKEICESYPNVKFYQNKDYIYANINFGMDHASGDWLMRLDSDEIVSPELAMEIKEDVLSKDDDPNSGYWVPNRVFFFGKWIKFGPAYDKRSAGKGFGYRKILFKKGTARYECKREHEDMVTTGTYGCLQGHYDHFSHDSISMWITKMNYYTDRDTERIDATPARLSRGYAFRMVVVPILTFFKLYFQFKGYKDGMHGFIVCALNAWYGFMDRSKAWEKSWKSANKVEK